MKKLKQQKGITGTQQKRKKLGVISYQLSEAGAQELLEVGADPAFAEKCIAKYITMELSKSKRKK